MTVKDSKSENWEKAELYDFSEFKKEDFLRRINNFVKPIVLNNLPQKRLKILDAGCGGGIDVICLALLGNYVTGIDISQKMLNSAKLTSNRASEIFKKNISLKFEKADLFNLSKYKNCFDVVLNFYIIQMWKEKEKRVKILNNLKRALTKEGILLIATTNTSNFLLRSIPKTELGSDPTYYNYVNLQEELEEVGFKVLKIKHLGLSGDFDKYLSSKSLKYPLIFGNYVYSLLPNFIKKYFAPHSLIMAKK